MPEQGHVARCPRPLLPDLSELGMRELLKGGLAGGGSAWSPLTQRAACGGSDRAGGNSDRAALHPRSRVGDRHGTTHVLDGGKREAVYRRARHAHRVQAALLPGAAGQVQHRQVQLHGCCVAPPRPGLPAAVTTIRRPVLRGSGIGRAACGAVQRRLVQRSGAPAGPLASSRRTPTWTRKRPLPSLLLSLSAICAA